jgi:hypothetical protein
MALMGRPEYRTITWDDYHQDINAKALADRAIASMVYPPTCWIEIRIAEGWFEVDWIWDRDMAVRTTRYERFVTAP